jgi:hypothetical protein
MKKLTAVLITVLAILPITVTEVFADGKPYGPYSPYTPHKPIPTGLEDTTIIYFAALVMFVIGMSLLTTVKILKDKQSL